MFPFLGRLHHTVSGFLFSPLLSHLLPQQAACGCNRHMSALPMLSVSFDSINYFQMQCLSIHFSCCTLFCALTVKIRDGLFADGLFGPQHFQVWHLPCLKYADKNYLERLKACLFDKLPVHNTVSRALLNRSVCFVFYLRVL